MTISSHFLSPFFFLINYSSPMTCWTVPPELLLLLICIFIVSSRCVLTVFFSYSCIEVAHIWTAVAILSQTIGAVVWDPWYNLPNPCKLSFLGGKKNVKPHVIRSCWQKKLHTGTLVTPSGPSWVVWGLRKTTSILLPRLLSINSFSEPLILTSVYYSWNLCVSRVIHFYL